MPSGKEALGERKMTEVDGSNQRARKEVAKEMSRTH